MGSMSTCWIALAFIMTAGIGFRLLDINAAWTAETLRIWLQTGAIIVALGIFAVRELLEARRRYDAKIRKIGAIKIVLARACELNHWTARTIKTWLKNFESADDTDKFSIEFLFDGEVRITKASEGGTTSSIVPEVQSDDFKSQLLPIAELDTDLTNLLEAVITGLAELRHIRDSMIKYVNGDLPFPEESKIEFLKSFSTYGLPELNESVAVLKNLYAACTGRNLQTFRLR